MNRKSIPTDIQRQLWADSGGLCANPQCGANLLNEKGRSIGEMAHIQAYSTSKNNDVTNLLLLCSNCHTAVDKKGNNKELKSWKKTQQERNDKFRNKKFKNIKDLSKVAKPILEKNKLIFEKYCLHEKSQSLWKKFEPQVLGNNKYLRLLFENNLHLFQGNKGYPDDNDFSAQRFILHTEEFEKTRGNKEKIRTVLFPEKINSIFGICPINGRKPVNVSPLQNLIKKLKKENRFLKLDLISDDSFLQYYSEDKKLQTLFLDDTPNVQQIFWDTYSYRQKNSTLRLENVEFFIQWLAKNNFEPVFLDETDLSHIKINTGHNIKIVFEYCLSAARIRELSPKKGLLIINLHFFNGEECISADAYKLGESMKVKIFTAQAFYSFCHNELRKQ